jgi:hypothetical protein
VHNRQLDRLRPDSRDLERDNRTTTIAKNESGLFANRMQYRESVTRLLAYLEVLRIISGATRVTAPVIGDDPELIRQHRRHRTVETSVATPARNH